MIVALIVLAWLVCSTFAARLILRMWWRDVGSYSGVLALVVACYILPPIMVLIGLFDTIENWSDNHVGGITRIFDRIRGKM
jgi:ABC-type glycerol-3-phosphate transport system permease component